MTLSFSKKWKDGKPTYFVDKIWEGIIDHDKVTPRHYRNYQEELEDLHDETFEGWNLIKVYPKIHTIREDRKNRWKVGNDIHFVINNRTPKRFQFAPILKVKSVQKIRIKIESDGEYRNFKIVIDDKLMFSTYPFDKYFWTLEDFQKFVINDGFPTIEKFLEWFNKDFEGKIIHWTDTIY